MQNLEALTLLVATAGIVWSLIATPPRRIHLAIVVGWLAIAIIQAIFEGARVHLLPTYALGGMLAALAWWRPRRRARLLVAAPIAATVFVAVGLPIVFPVFKYDQPDGPYGIGTTTYALPGADHDLAVQLWYPTATGAAGPRARVTARPDRLASAYAQLTGLPAPLFDHLRLIETDAVESAPLATSPARLPIVLFSHGPISGNRSQSIFQMEALASHGFIVVAIDHTGYSSLTVFPDGHTAGVEPDARWPVFADDGSRALVRRWVADVRRVLDFLEGLDRKDPRGVFDGRLALDRIGYLGASFGGSVVVEALTAEPRIKAGVAEDGKPYFFDHTLTDLRAPLLYLQSELPYIPVGDAQLASWGVTQAGFAEARADHYDRLTRLVASARGPFYDVLIRGTNHISFSDLHFLLRFPDGQLTAPRHTHRIINAYTVAFFERYLADTPSPLVDGTTPSPFQDVAVTVRNVSARLAVTP